MLPSLAPLEEAAQELGVPKGSLCTAAEEHGFIVRMGRAVHIGRNDFQTLVEKSSRIRGGAEKAARTD